MRVENLQALMSIQIFHTSDDVVCRTEKKQTENPPPTFDTSQRYLQHLSMCAYRTKIRPSYPV